MTVVGQIRERIESIPAGTPFTTKEFLLLGSRAAVDQALVRLVKAEEITRLARGVFVRPRHNQYVGAVMPGAAEVARALAGREGAELEVHGAEAARRFGLTTQMPTRPVFATSGRSRRFRLGQLEVSMRHVSPRKLALAGRPAGVALSALTYLGRREVTPEVIQRVAARLPPEEYAALRSATTAMPGWLIAALHREKSAPVGR